MCSLSINLVRIMNKINLQFFTACTLGNISTIKKLIDKIDIDKYNYRTPLMVAALNGHYDIVKLLIKYGANVNIQDTAGFTALHLSVEHNKITSLLIDTGANINQQNNAGDTPLMCCKSNHKTAIYLVNKGADIEITNIRGDNALHTSALHGNLKAIKLLLEKGTNIDRQNKYGYTALILSATTHNPNMVKILLNNGANINILDKHGESAYDKALEYHCAMSALLLKPENNKEAFYDTALFDACQNKDVRNVIFLKKKGANFFVENDDGDSAYKVLNRKKSLPEQLIALRDQLTHENVLDSSNTLQ